MKHGKPCPGYRRGFKFVPGRPDRRRRIRGMDSSKTASNHVDEEFQGIYQPLIEPFGLANATILQSLNVLIDDFSTTPFSPSSPHIVPRWFGFLPGIHGRNMTKDAILYDFSSLYSGLHAQSTVEMSCQVTHSGLASMLIRTGGEYYRAR